MAKEFSNNNFIIDTHIDAPMRLNSKWEDLSLKTEGNFDYPKAIEGGLNLAFMSIYIPARLQKEGGAKELADELIDLVEKTVANNPDKFEIQYSPNSINPINENQKILLALGMENGAGLEDDIKNIEYFYKRGIRYITLAHSKSNLICDSSYDPEIKWKGLSPFGRAVVKEMNRVGIMIDISHVTDSTFYQVMKITDAPVIASHSACRAFTPGWERNMSDDMLMELAKNGGVIQINFGSEFISTDVNSISLQNSGICNSLSRQYKT